MGQERLEMVVEEEVQRPGEGVAQQIGGDAAVEGWGGVGERAEEGEGGAEVRGVRVDCGGKCG